MDSIITGECKEVLRTFADSSVDLIVTSPPYADRRARVYGGVQPDEYVEWFVPIADELRRVLKPSGSLILNIKEIAVNGERHTYVVELILEMRRRGWLWTEEYIWHKKNCYPGKWPNRFRDAWERCLHFTKQKNFAMYQEAVMVAMGDWRHSRLGNLSETDRRRDASRVMSGFGKRIENWVGRERAYPTNVLHLATECANKGHSATFPVALPAWFIKLLTKAGDLVLDPFVGSGTTAVACKQLGRHYVGIDINPEYCELARSRVAACRLLEKNNGRRRTRTTDPPMPLELLCPSDKRARRTRPKQDTPKEEPLFVSR
jgi:DNA modification methylase